MSTGAGNDIERATELARQMVCEYGMSKLGPLTFGKKEEQIFLGREISQHRDYSEDTAIKIDGEVRRLIQEGYDKAKNILETGSDVMHAMAAALLEREVLDANEIKALVEGRPMPTRINPPTGGAPADEVQQVLKPEPSGRPGLAPGERPSPA
jgi:cell division protease FtsH